MRPVSLVENNWERVDHPGWCGTRVADEFGDGCTEQHGAGLRAYTWCLWYRNTIEQKNAGLDYTPRDNDVVNNTIYNPSMTGASGSYVGTSFLSVERGCRMNKYRTC
ncbi:MAG: hypothetical protein R3F28_03290 [Candidatus Kapaibacterium sp.]